MPASTFSYAQAAKGLSSSTKAASHPPTSNTVDDLPAAKTGNEPPTNDAALSNSKELEQSQAQPSSTKQSQAHDVASRATTERSSDKTAHNDYNGSISPPSMDLIQSSMSTLPHEDDLSSVPAASSESTWENVSQASMSAEKAQDVADKTGKKENKDGSWVQVAKPQVEAPIPVVNIWKQRMEQNAKSIPILPKKAPSTNGSNAPPAASANPRTSVSNNASDKKPENARPTRGKDIKRELRTDNEHGKFKREPSRLSENSHKVHPPSLQDEASWPTPELAQDEDRKKSVDKDDKLESAKAPVKKAEWKKVELQHNVIWQTPLPNTHPRRGGRGGARGSREGPSTRTSPSLTRSTRSTIAQTAADAPAKSEATVASDGAPHVKKHDSSAKQSVAASKEPPNHESHRSDTKSPRVADADDESSHRSASVPNHAGNKSGLGIDVGGAAGEASHERTGNPSHKPSRHTSKSHDAEEDLRAAASDSHFARHGSKSNHTSSGGGRRGSVRGRGGYSGYHNHHSPAVGWPASPNIYSAKSPTVVADPYSGAMQSQRGFRTPRAQGSASFSNGYSSAGMLSPINTYPSRATFEQQAQTMSAIPYNGMMEQYNLYGMVSMQLEYYFSLENLLRDMYLRKHMDSQGFVVLDVIAGFNRLKNLTQDLEVLKVVCQQSVNIEYRLGVDGKSRIRKLEGWDQFVLDKKQRDPGAQHDGVESIQPMAGPYQAIPDQAFFNSYRHSSLPQPLSSPQYAPYVNGQVYSPQYFSPQPMDSSQRFQASPPMFSQPFANGRPISHHRSISGSNGYPATNGVSGFQPQPIDIIPDSQVDNLVIMTREPTNSQKPDSAGTSAPAQDSRTAPEISPNIPAVATASNEGSATKHFQTATQANEARHRESASTSITVDERLSEPQISVWEKSSASDLLRDQSHEANEHSIRPERYIDVRANALEQRRLRASQSFFPHDMVVLYQFWCHYLVSNFNTRMFEEFARLAEEDLQTYDNVVGIRNLATYFSNAFSAGRPLPPPVVASKFVKLAEMGMDTSSRCRMVFDVLSAFVHEASSTHAASVSIVLDLATSDLRRALG